jgi:FkbM family methyltransferase
MNQPPMKELLKKILKSLPVDFTKNQQYDTQTKQVIARVCKPESVCIDIGCHKGEVLDLILKYSPASAHFGFEPIPDMYAALKEKYQGKPYRIYDYALSNVKGEVQFNYVVTNPAYSGIKKRQYDRADEKDTQITVKTEMLDALTANEKRIDLIKIDVEGGELLVLQGAKETIKRFKPVIIFEHGLGASDAYGATPELVFDLLTDCGMKVSTMKRWLKKENNFSKEEFSKQYHERMNYYFIAYA